MQTLKQQTIVAISNLPDMAGIDEITAVLRDIITANEPSEKMHTVSCFDLMKDSVGCVKDAPGDLSANKAYMQGYGQ